MAYSLLYNDCPTWLADARARLDRAAFAAYGWPEDVSDEDILKALLASILERSSPDPPRGDKPYRWIRAPIRETAREFFEGARASAAPRSRTPAPRPRHPDESGYG